MPAVDDRLRLQVIDQLTGQWRKGKLPSVEDRRDNVHPAAFALIFGLAQHVYRLSELTRPHWDEGARLELAPVVRTQMECAANAQWLALRGFAALPAWLTEASRAKTNLVGQMLKAEWKGVTPEIVDEMKSRAPIVGGGDGKLARTMEGILMDFAGGASLYVVYRDLSGHSHPSLSIVDAYVKADGNDEDKVRLRHDGGSTFGDDVIILMSVCWSLVWSARALDWVTATSPRRHELNRVARLIGMPGAMLDLSNDGEKARFLEQHRR